MFKMNDKTCYHWQIDRNNPLKASITYAFKTVVVTNNGTFVAVLV